MEQCASGEQCARAAGEQRADGTWGVVRWKLRGLLMPPPELVAEVRERMLLRLLLHGEQQKGEEQRDETGIHGGRLARRSRKELSV